MVKAYIQQETLLQPLDMLLREDIISHQVENLHKDGLIL